MLLVLPHLLDKCSLLQAQTFNLAPCCSILALPASGLQSRSNLVLPPNNRVTAGLLGAAPYMGLLLCGALAVRVLVCLCTAVAALVYMCTVEPMVRVSLPFCCTATSTQYWPDHRQPKAVRGIEAPDWDCELYSCHPGLSATT